jgi:cathepsin L
MGINKFTDMTKKELSKFLGLKKSSRKNTLNSKNDVKFFNKEKKNLNDYPKNLDWSEKGAITAIKDQGQCGSCWAFASTEGVESAWFIATGELLELSPQQFVDCVVNTNECGGKGGCEGATVEVAYDYLKSTKNGLALEANYPYKAKDGVCKTSVEGSANLISYKKVSMNSYEDVMAAIQYGPLAISVDASSWFSYSGGIYDGCDMNQPDLDHAVQLVGYGEDGQGNYWWKIRNSWGSSWAEDGYIRVRRYPDGNAPSGMDITPQDGEACKGDTDPVKVVGMCGLLYDTVLPIAQKP